MNIFSQTKHRPYPLPKGPWVGRQDWHCVTFAHWPIEPEALAERLPRQLMLDTFDGQGWLSIVAVKVSNNRLRGLPPFPGFSSFSQVNVRTYITMSGKPGIYTFSMDASHPIINRAARYLGHLNYLDAHVKVSKQRQLTAVKSIRTDRKAAPAEYEARFETASPVFQAGKGSLAYWLTERYCLYTVTADGNVLRYDIHHPPWKLQDAKVELITNTVTDAIGLSLPNPEPLLHVAEKQKVVLWPPCKVQ